MQESIFPEEPAGHSVSPTPAGPGRAGLGSWFRLRPFFPEGSRARGIRVSQEGALQSRRPAHAARVLRGKEEVLFAQNITLSRNSINSNATGAIFSQQVEFPSRIHQDGSPALCLRSFVPGKVNSSRKRHVTNPGAAPGRPGCFALPALGVCV